jgi:hypothetical protein
MHIVCVVAATHGTVLSPRHFLIPTLQAIHTTISTPFGPFIVLIYRCLTFIHSPSSLVCDLCSTSLAIQAGLRQGRTTFKVFLIVLLLSFVLHDPPCSPPMSFISLQGHRREAHINDGFPVMTTSFPSLRRTPLSNLPMGLVFTMGSLRLFHPVPTRVQLPSLQLHAHLRSNLLLHLVSIAVNAMSRGIHLNQRLMHPLSSPSRALAS